MMATQYEAITADRECPDCGHTFHIEGTTRWHNDAALQYQLDTLVREHAESDCPKQGPAEQQEG